MMNKTENPGIIHKHHSSGHTTGLMHLNAGLRETNKRLRQLAEHIQDVFFLLEWPTRQPLYITPSFERFWGFKSGQLYSQPDGWLDAVHPDDKGRVSDLLATDWAQTGLHLEYRLLRSNGLDRWIRDRWYVLPDQTERVPRVIRQVTDISDCKRTEQCLRRLATVVSDSNDAVTLVDMEGDIEAWNHGAETMYGYAESDAIGMSMERLIPDIQKDTFHHILHRIEQGETIGSHETLRLRKDGTLMDIWLTASPLRDDTGRIVSAAVTERDITERKWHCKALAASEMLFRGTFEQAAVGMAHLSEEGVCLRMNQRLCDILGITVSEMAHYTLEDWIDEHELASWHQLWQDQRSACTFQKQLLREDRTLVWVQITVSRVQTAHPQADFAVLVVQDISQRKAHEQRVLHYQEQLKALASEMTLAEEHLRRRVATQLHDTIGQSLALTKLKLDTVKQNLEDDDVYDELVSISQILQQSMALAQSMTRQLSYPILGVLGLEKAIEKWLEDEIQNHGLQTRFETDHRAKPLTEDMSLVLFRSVRELLNNVIKHAKAKVVTVTTREQNNQAVITIDDDGKGCDPDTAMHKGLGFGLLSIREALERLGGHFQLDSQPGSGCHIILTAPLLLSAAL